MINWSTVYKLNANEFSEDPNKYAEPALIYALSDVRQYSQERMFPSPVPGALARFGGSRTSQHYVGKDEMTMIRRSTGVDVFCEGIPFGLYTTIIGTRMFKGIGVYLDTTGPDGLPWIMFHLDIRDQGFNKLSPLIWIAEKVLHKDTGKKVTKYRYPQADHSYWELLNDKRFYLDKKYALG